MLFELTNSIKQFLSLCPEYIYEFLNNNVFMNVENIIDLLITSFTDKMTRYSTIQILLHAINIAVKYFKLDLSM